MKFFWKIFFAFTALMTIGFSFFGIWMITQSFRSSLETEIEDGNRENRIFQLTFEVNMNSLPENYRTERVVRDLSETVVANLDKQEYGYRVYKGKNDLLYESGGTAVPHSLLEQIEEDACIYQVLSREGHKYLIFLCRSRVGGEDYYLESIKDISSLYEERDGMFSQYRIVMLTLVAISSIIILLLTHFLTKPMTELARTTRRYAEGDYEVRAMSGNEDEIGILADNFNFLADNLNQKMEELTQTAQKQEDFTASFAHELKTPLTSIIGYSDMLRTMEMDKEETMEAANYIHSQGKRLEALSLKLLELIVTKNQDYQFKVIRVAELMDEVRIVVGASLKKKNITLHEEIAEGRIYGERDLLISLWTNLIDNARKALPEGGEIWISGKEIADGYEMKVRDNGVGIAEGELAKITEAFYMVDKSRSRKEGGAGLGMTLCSRIVEVHSAKWFIRSKEGRGTEIWVVFPKAPKQERVSKGDKNQGAAGGGISDKTDKKGGGHEGKA